MSAFVANLSVLRRHFREVARLVEAGRGSPAPCRIEPARNGEPTMRLSGNGPYLHSRFDPGREGRRLAESIPEAVGYLAFWGPGLFYEVEALLERELVSRVLVVEPEAAMLREALSARDLTAVLSDSRVHLICGSEATASRAAAFVSETYLPVLHGAFKLQTPRARAEAAAATAAAIRAATRAQIDDLAIQRRFSFRWFSNAVRNLLTLPPVTVELPRAERVVVAAAGPSLEAEIADLDGSIPVIATDTALPALLKNGVRPLAVVSLDCQQVSYHHFLAGRSIEESAGRAQRARNAGARSPASPGAASDSGASFPLVADLSSPPTLFREHTPGVFTATNYPFARMLRSHFPGIAFVDGGGGNVTQAALSLVDGLGARTVHLIGADLSYPAGKPYARDTYLYPYFRSHETRLEPTHGKLFDLVLSDPATRVEVDDRGRVYFTPRLDEYRRRLEAFAASLRAEMRFGSPGADNTSHEPAVEGPGNLRGAGGRPEDRARIDQGEKAQRVLSVPPLEERRAFLSQYLARLEALDAPEAPTGRNFLRMSEEQREIWVTLFPTAASFLDTELDAQRSAEALSAAKRWAVQTLAGAMASTA